MSKVLSIAIGERDFRRLKRWAEKRDMTPEQLLSQLIGDERVRRKARSEGSE